MKTISILIGVFSVLATSCVMIRSNLSVISQDASTDGRIGSVQPSSQGLQADKRSDLDTAVSNNAGAATTGGGRRRSNDTETTTTKGSEVPANDSK